MPLYKRTVATAAASGALNGLRLTLESGVPVSTTDQTAKTTIYLTPHTSGLIDLWDGAKWVTRSTAEVSAALGTLTSVRPYDVFAYYTGSAVALEFVSWTSDTVRASALSTQDGIYTKNSDATRRYVGTFRTTSTTTTEDSAAKRFVYNGPEPWRQVSRALVSPAETANSWTYNSTTIRQANANSANKVEFVIGLTTDVNVELVAVGSVSSAGPIVGIGIDSTTAFVAGMKNAYAGSTSQTSMVAKYAGSVVAGYHYAAWLEVCITASTANFFGDAGVANVQSGLIAQIPG